jgi:hypothetical protein
MPVNKHPLGPGTLTIGEVGSEVDLSAQIITCQIEWDKDKDDDITVLNGEVAAGAIKYTATITGEMFQDISDPAGIVMQSWGALKGMQVPFEFTPNTAAATTAVGELIVDPVTFGGDEAEANMTADFEWDIVGEPTLSPTIPATATSEGSEAA